jgi:CHAT domain-containing protein
MTRRVRWASLTFLPVVALAGLSAPAVFAQTAADRPAAVIEQAQRAVSADTVPAAVTRWRARLARDPNDRLARLGVAVAAGLTNDSAAAEREFQVLLADDSRDAARVAPYARLGQGMLYYSLGRFDDASRMFAESAAGLQIANDSLGEAQGLIYLVWLDIRKHQPTAAARLARADSLTRFHGDTLRGAWDCAHANLLSSQHLPGAVEAADSGYALALQHDDFRLAASCQFAAAADEADRGRIDQALPRLGTVIILAARTHDHPTHAAALQWRGYARLNLGDYGLAENDLLAAAAEAAAHRNLAAVGWSELNLAALSEELGDFAGAERHATRSLEALAAIGDSAGLGILRRSAGRRALAAGDTAGARRDALEALRHAQRLSRVADQKAAHDVLAAIDAHEGRWDAAAAEIATERPMLSASRSESWARLIPWEEGRIALGRGDTRTAVRQLHHAESLMDSTQHLFREEVRVDIAVALLRLGDTARAIAALQRAEDELDAWRATLNTEALRVQVFSANEPIPGPPGGIASVIAAATRSQRTAVAFALTERQRARELADQVVRAEALGIRSDSTVVPRSRTTSTVALADIQRALPDDSTALLEFVAGAGTARTTLFAITRHRVWTWFEAPVDSIVETIDRLDALVDQGAPASAPERELGAALLAGVEQLPRVIHRLIIVPDGHLHRVPFAALRLSDGVSVVERYAVSLAPSATVIAAEWRRPLLRRTGTVLAFGDPVLPVEGRALVDEDRGLTPPDSVSIGADTAPSQGEREVAAPVDPPADSSLVIDRNAASALQAAGALPRLPWTGDEAALVGSFGERSTVRLRAQASAAFLQSARLDGFSIVHFATHAVVDEDVPARSALALAAGGGRSGYVGPADLAGLRLTADLVVLSACRTARGAVVAGEGVRGLTAPLLAAGSRSVLATQWRLNDKQAVPLVYTLYLQMAKGLPLTEAVRRAELAARRAGRPEREWASFILVGDPLVRMMLHAPPTDRAPGWVQPYE